MSSSPSPTKGRRTPESKNNNVNDILSGAKKNFLSATDNVVGVKTPLKRTASSSESPELGAADVASPKSLLKHPSISLGTPPKKEPKLWKTRWQAKINGRLNEGRGKKRRGNEADKLLDDEGVIQMLNKVPSVFGVMPRSASSTSNRAQRVRAAANKVTSQPQPVTKPAKAATKRHGSTDSKKIKLDVKQAVKLEPVDTSDPVSTNGDSKHFVSPKRAVRNISRDFSTQEAVAENLGPMMKDDDCFVHLTELPSEQLELLMNCDIRYSLPKQGAPVQNKPSKSRKEETSSKTKSPQVDPKKSSPESSKSSLNQSSAALVKVKPSNLQSSFFKNASNKLPPIPVNSTENRLKVRII